MRTNQFGDREATIVGRYSRIVTPEIWEKVVKRSNDSLTDMLVGDTFVKIWG